MKILRFLSALLFVGFTVAGWAAEVSNLQTGTVTSTGNGAVTVTLSQVVDPARSVLLFSTRHNSNRPPGSMIRGQLASPTSVIFERVSNETSSMDIRWTVVEFASGVTVQRGSFDATADTQDISLAHPVGTTTQAFVLWSKTPRANDSAFNRDNPTGGYLLDTGTLRFLVEGSNSGHVVDYQVVEFSNPGELFVQTGVTPMGGGPLSIDVTLPVAVDPATSMVLAGYTSRDAGPDIGERMLNAQLVDATTARFAREISGDRIVDVIWQVVEFRDGTQVQRGLEVFGPGDAIRTVSLPTVVDTGSSVGFSGMMPVGGLNMGSSDYVGDDIIGTGSYTFDLSVATLDIQRSNVSSSGTVGWFVVSFSGTTPAVLSLDLRMDELNWTGAAGEVTDTQSGFDGTPFGGVTTAGDNPALVGNPGTCRYADFDGADDYVLVPHDPALNGSSALVYSAWVYPRSWSGIRQIMAKSVHGGGSGAAQMGLFSEAGVLKLRAETLSGSLEATATLPALDTWSHVAGVFSGDELEIYVDGVLAGSNSFGTTTLVQTTDDLAISKRVGSNEYFFDGFIDEARVYTTALDASQIQVIVNATHPCPTAPLGEWHLDEFGWNGTPGEVVDYSGNDYNGTAFNTVTDTGRVCNAADLVADGVNDYLGLDHTPFNGLTDFTIATWYRGAHTGHMTILSGARSGEPDELVFSFNTTDRFRPLVLGGGGVGVAVPGLMDGNWHFVAWTREGDSNCLFMDDVLQGCVSRPTGPVTIDAGGLIVGQEQGSVGGGFTSGRDLEGDLDELLLFDEVLSQAELAQIRANNVAGLDWDGSPRSCPVTGATGFVLNHDNAGIHCVDEPVAVTAVDAASVVVTSYANNVTLQTSTNRGTWSVLSGNGVFDDTTPDDGAATYVFVAADNGSATFALSYPEGPALVDVDAYQTNDITVHDDDAEGLLEFAPSGFTLTQNLLPNPPPVPISDPLQTQIAGNPFGLHITAYGVTDDDPECGVIESYDGNRDLKFSMSHDNPGTGTRVATVDGTTIVTNPAAATGQTVSFSAGQAQVLVNYKDVGVISLAVADDASFPNTLNGATNSFVVKPASLAVTRVESSTGSANTGPISLLGDRFVPAGEMFEVDVSALDADGEVTPNFGLESPAESVRVSSPALVLPLGGRNGSGGDVTNGVSFTLSANPGTLTNASIFFDETGIITLMPALADNNYLGGGAVAGASSGNVGRFYPDRFELVSSNVSPACGTFTYLGEPALDVSYRLQAQNTGGAATWNYDFADLAAPVATVSYVAESADDGVDRASRLSLTVPDWDDGEIVVNRTDVSFARLAAADGPFDTLQLGLRVVDSLDPPVTLSMLDMNPDTVGDCVLAGDCDAQNLGAASRFLYGRLAVLPSFGPEDRDLDVGLEAQSFTGSAFAQNVLDNCSAYSTPLASFGVYAGNLADGETSWLAPLASTALVTGAADATAPLTLSAPGIGNDGSVGVIVNVPAWLEFDWFGGGVADPRGTATFGRYRGHDRIIFWREQR